MKSIAERLHENRQIELAKSILESNGYKVSKIDESTESEYFANPIIVQIQVSDGQFLEKEEVLRSLDGASCTPELIEDLGNEMYTIALPSKEDWLAILAEAGLHVDLLENVRESAGNELKFEDLVTYPYQFNKVWNGAPNSTYSDDLLELAEEYNCLQIKYSDGYNNTKFICKDKSDYENLKDALSQRRILRDFISLSQLLPMDWDSVSSKVDSIYVDRYSGGYSVRIPKPRHLSSDIDELLDKVGGSKVVNDIINDAIEANPDLADDMEYLADASYFRVYGKVSHDEWKEIIEYVR